MVRAGGYTALARGAHGVNKILVGLIAQQVEVEVRRLARLVDRSRKSRYGIALRIGELAWFCRLEQSAKAQLRIVLRIVARTAQLLYLGAGMGEFINNVGHILSPTFLGRGYSPKFKSPAR